MSPPRLTLEPWDVDVLNYEVTISRNDDLETQKTILNGNIKQYDFKPSTNNDYCGYLKFCIAPNRSAVVKEVQECVKSSLKRGIAILPLCV